MADQPSSKPQWYYNAISALRQGDKRRAYDLAGGALVQGSDAELPYLILAAASDDPNESIRFLEHALEINPGSRPAREGLEWARRRLDDHVHAQFPEPIAELCPETDEAPLAPELVEPPPDPGSTLPAQTLPLIVRRVTRRAVKKAHPRRSWFWVAAQRLLYSLLILVSIAYLTVFSQDLAQAGREGVAINLGQSALDALKKLGDYIFNHPPTYLWHREVTPAFDVVWTLVVNSAGLLMVSLLLATALGVLFGTIAALYRRLNVAPLMILVSILGISVPSFLLAMLLWVANTKAYQLLQTSTAPLPPTGFGWDLHLVMPAIVLAARPLAQIMQVTYVSLQDVLNQDYLRSVRARGANERYVLFEHAYRNILIPVLTTLGTSLRFSLASLPVVESFFLWPGLGSALLVALDRNMGALVTDIIVSLGFLFLLLNFLLEVLYPRLDPRILSGAAENLHDESQWKRFGGGFGASLRALFAPRRKRQTQKIRPKGQRGHAAKPAPQLAAASITTKPVHRLEDAAYSSSSKYLVRAILTNPALILGSLMVIALIVLVLFGSQMSPANPYQVNDILSIDGSVKSPPFAPSPQFPWGSDIVGRDIQALVLSGARQTLAMGLFATFARVVLGVLLGMLAGWWSNSWLDRSVQSAISILAAFPVTIFALLLILGIGIQKGMSVFVIALCVVGWGEIAQFVRAQVVMQKPLLYIESARAVGANPSRILLRHIMPHLLPGILVMSVLEMGGVLTLLAELGFLNIFLGGGFQLMIGEVGRMQPVFFYFSDVPEWGALLANIRNWWRSYPWVAWYPGLFFFLSILTFNLWGEGLRRFIEDSRLNVSKLFNRYTLALALAFVVGVGFLLRSTSPIVQYTPQAKLFDAAKAMPHIAALSSPEFAGRESGTDGGRKAAEYIAAQMEAIGLFPAGDGDTFIQSISAPRAHLGGIPSLQIIDTTGEPQQTLIYRQDFVEHVYLVPLMGEAAAPVVGVPLAASTGGSLDERLKVISDNLEDKILIIRESDLDRLDLRRGVGYLIISEDPEFTEKRYVYPQGNIFQIQETSPSMLISPALADQLLAPAGGLAAMDALAQSLPPGAYGETDQGLSVRMNVPLQELDNSETYYNVIGYIPGFDAVSGLDSQVIIVSAYYDGIGTGPDGTFFPGANDNASGVAAMLEIARVLKQEALFDPDKTVVFVAWSGGERQEALSDSEVMNAKGGFGLLNVEVIFELSGMGAGSGDGIAIGQGTAFRLATLITDAANRLNIPVTPRGRGPHFGQYTQLAFGGREALSAYLHWDGSDYLAHTPRDVYEIINPRKLQQTGETAMLVLTIISREVNY